ncbi:hypothetical protein C1I95_14755 [Micromonospora craterilacus]|uniref:Uncharacterized protein n=1 Tax=Micromonospora craterilacus TaxID=1655439 RepID=A0A2W2F892_9ACTN|nr:hypothetical protein C1I95_14755 [Micromonospora craterilacus]
MVREAEQAGGEAGRAFSDSFNRALTGRAKTLFAGLRRQAETATDGAGDKAGRTLGADIVRQATARMRDERGRFAAAGTEAGAAIGDGITREASARLRDARGRFAAAGNDSGSRFGDGFAAEASQRIRDTVTQRLRDERGRFAREGDEAGGGFGDRFAHAFDRRGISTAHGRVRSLVVGIIALIPALVPVLAGATAALVGLGTAAIALFAGLGVGVLAILGVAEAVKQLGASEEMAAQRSQAMARAHEAVRSAAESLRSAEQNLARTKVQNAESAAAAARRIEDAERSLTRAQRDARDVVRELDEARERSRRRLDDLHQTLAENALSQRQANLDVAEAKLALDKIIADPQASDGQREQARIAYERQVLQLGDLQRRERELQADQKAAVKAGVEGSDEMERARKRIADANERVKEAERSLADARKARAKEEREGAYRLQQAQQQVASAQRALAKANAETATAGVAAFAKLRDAMDNLSPAGQRFARFLHGLRDEFKRLRFAAQEGLLPGVQTAITNLLPYLPQVTRFVGDLASRMGDLAVRASEALQSPFWLSFFAMIRDVAGPALEGMFVATGNIVTGLMAILQAFLPLNRDMGTGFVAMTAAFSEWAQGLSDSDSFQGFVQYVRDTGPDVLALIGQLSRLLGKLLAGLAPEGAGLLAGIVAGIRWLADLSPRTLGQVGMAISGIAGAVLAFNAVAKIASIATTAWGLAQKGVAVGAKIWAGAQWLLNASLWGFPLTWILAALVALGVGLVVAYRKSETFRAIVQKAWSGIQAAASFAWDKVIKPIFSGLKWWISNVVGPWFTWLWQRVVKPAWTGIQIGISVAWAIIKVIFGLIHIYVKTVLGPIFTWLWKNVIDPVWKNIKIIFTAFGGFLKEHVVPAFKSGVEAIGKAWEKIKDVAKIPVRFVVNTIVNEAIIDNFNKLATVFGVSKVDRVKLPKGFARGGVLPGWSPGRDVHRFVSPTGGAIDLSGGEAIIRPEGTRALGRGWVDGINAAARAGGVGGVQRFLGGAYAGGGVIDWLGRQAKDATKKATDVISGAKGLLTDPAGVLRSVVSKVIDLVPGKDTTLGKLAIGLPSKAVGWAIDKVKSVFGRGEDGGSNLTGTSPLGGSAGMMRMLRAVFPALPLWSGYRPGSTTLSGSRSYHAYDRAVDVPPIRAVAKHIFETFRHITKELITPYPEFNLLRGKPHRYTGAVWRQHNFAGGNAHNHWSARLGGIVPAMGARLFDRGGDWPSGTVGVNLSGRTEHVSTGSSMDTVAALLAGIRKDLRELRDAVRRVGAEVGVEINGAASTALHRGRALG